MRLGAAVGTVRSKVARAIDPLGIWRASAYGPKIGVPLTWSISTDLGSKLAVLLTAFVAIQSLSANAFGQFVGLSAVALLAAAFLDAGVSLLVTREVAARLLPTSAAIKGGVVCRVRTLPAWLIIFFVGVLAVGRHTPLSAQVIAAFAAGSIVFATHALVIGILRGHHRFLAAGVALAAGRWLTAIASLLALSSPSESRLNVLAWAMVAGELLTLGLGLGRLFTLSRVTGPFGVPVLTSLSLKAAFPFGANAILATAYNRFDVVILAALSTGQQLGFYAPATRIQDALYLIPASLGIVTLPFAAETNTALDRTELRRLALRVGVVGLCLSVPITVAIFLAAPRLIAIILGSQYMGALTATRILVWFLPLAAIQAPLLEILVGGHHSAKTTTVFLMAFGTAVTAHLCLDWWAGATGAAIASLSREPVALITIVVILRNAKILADTRSIKERWSERVAARGPK